MKTITHPINERLKNIEDGDITLEKVEEGFKIINQFDSNDVLYSDLDSRYFAKSFKAMLSDSPAKAFVVQYLSDECIEMNGKKYLVESFKEDYPELTDDYNVSIESIMVESTDHMSFSYYYLVLTEKN